VLHEMLKRMLSDFEMNVLQVTRSEVLPGDRL